jgi:N-acetyl-gamma-glutamyl-phosphate reductase
MTKTAAVVGASGYAGLELLRILAGHPDIEVTIATAQRAAGTSVAASVPSMATAYPALQFTELDVAALAEVDIVYLALPHGASQAIVPTLRNPYVIDLAADFRLTAEEHLEWYGAHHTAPALLDEFVCGLPELFGPDLAGATRVAAPGCYPTAVTLALAPLVAAGTIATDGIVANALSGVSGRGRSLSQGSLFSEVNDSAHAYGLASHRHTPEMERMLAAHSASEVRVLFTPHLVPMTRGIVATCTAPLAEPGLTSTELAAQAEAFYADAPFVTVTGEPAPTKAVLGTNHALVTYRVDARTNTAIAVGVIDNLVKGTSGQAVQATNRMLGFPETTGLDQIAMWP